MSSVRALRETGGLDTDTRMGATAVPAAHRAEQGCPRSKRPVLQPRAGAASVRRQPVHTEARPATTTKPQC
jgi:hypothetical protein